MRKTWLGAALLGAWLSAGAEAQTPSTSPPGRASVSGGSAPFPNAPPATYLGGSIGRPSMPEPAPMSTGTMPPPALASTSPAHEPSSMQGYPPSGYPSHDGHSPNPYEALAGVSMGKARAWYVSFGAMSLQRERLGGNLAVLDVGNGDTGIAPQVNRPGAADLGDMEMDWMVGPRGTIGLHFGGCKAIELTGFYIPQDASYHTFANRGRLSSFFFNEPVGFEGNNFLWLQADVMRVSLRTELGNAELNCRWWPEPYKYFSWLLGVRYVDLWEKLDIFTDDDGLTIVDAQGRPDPRRQATYTIRTHNRILAPQLGFEWNIPLTPWVAATWQAKGAWGVNFLDADAKLERGDGFVGFKGQRSETFFSHLYDTGLYLDWKIHDCAKLRTGWTALWLVHVAEAFEQVDFNLEHTKGQRNPDGNIFYHGPVIELHLVF